jgi:histone deacetylase 1/2
MVLPSSCVLSFLALNKNIVRNSRCFNFQFQACSLGISLRILLRPTSYKTSSPLKLIFSDVWGPALMFASNGYCYFVIFMDAYMKYIWFFPLVAKYDVFTIFHQFQVLVKRQFSSKIIFVQTYWGSEYKNLSNFFEPFEFIIV